MPEDILAKTAPCSSGGPQKFSALSVILTIILAIVLVLLGERLIFDLNRWINPVIQQQYNLNELQTSPYSIGGSSYMGSLSVEKSALAPGVMISYPTQDRGEYLTYKLFIHAGFIFPVFLLVFLLYYFVKMKQQKEGWRVVIYGFMVFAFWMILHLLIEAGAYISSQYKSAAIYIILLVLAVILTPLAIFLQKKHSEKVT